MSTYTSLILEDSRENNSLHQNTASVTGMKSLHSYAWLEYDAGFWHFLTSPFACSGEADRKWPDEQDALDILENEGWRIVRAYPDCISEIPDNNFFGYGLHRLVH